MSLGKSEKRQLEDIMQQFKKMGIELKMKDGYGNPSAPYWSTSMGDNPQKMLIIK